MRLQDDYQLVTLPSYYWAGTGCETGISNEQRELMNFEANFMVIEIVI